MISRPRKNALFDAGHLTSAGMIAAASWMKSLLTRPLTLLAGIATRFTVYISVSCAPRGQEWAHRRDLRGLVQPLQFHHELKDNQTSVVGPMNERAPYATDHNASSRISTPTGSRAMLGVS